MKKMSREQWENCYRRVSDHSAEKIIQAFRAAEQAGKKEFYINITEFMQFCFRLGKSLGWGPADMDTYNMFYQSAFTKIMLDAGYNAQLSVHPGGKGMYWIRVELCDESELPPGARDAAARYRSGEM